MIPTTALTLVPQKPVMDMTMTATEPLTQLLSVHVILMCMVAAAICSVPHEEIGLMHRTSVMITAITWSPSQAQAKTVGSMDAQTAIPTKSGG